MKKVEIYDQYSNIYADSQNNGALGTVQLAYNEPLDTSRYTLVHAGSGFTTIEATDLTESEATSVVSNLYDVSKVTGTSYVDKLVQLDKGYAELVINFADGKKLNRVIYTVEQ